MKQLTFYKYLSFSLIGVNLLLIGLFLFTGPGRKPLGPDKRAGNAQQIMQMDEEQHEAFLQLATSHQAYMDSLNQKQKEIVGWYFSQLTEDAQILQADELLLQAQTIEEQKITSTFQHFLDVRNLLRPDQEEDFREFVRITLSFLSNNLKRGPRPGPPGRP